MFPPQGGADPGHQRTTGVFRDPQSPAPHTPGAGCRSTTPFIPSRSKGTCPPHPPLEIKCSLKRVWVSSLLYPRPGWHLNCVGHSDAFPPGIFLKVHVLRLIPCTHEVPWPHPTSASQGARGEQRRNALGGCSSFLRVGQGFRQYFGLLATTPLTTGFKLKISMGPRKPKIQVKTEPSSATPGQNPRPWSMTTYETAKLPTPLPLLGGPTPVLWAPRATCQKAEGRLVPSSQSWPGPVLP